MPELACFRESSVIPFSFHFLSSGDICMTSSYPLSRCPVSWFSLKWKVPVLGKLLNSAAARREFSRHGGLSFDEVFP